MDHTNCAFIFYHTRMLRLFPSLVVRSSPIAVESQVPANTPVNITGSSQGLFHLSSTVWHPLPALSSFSATIPMRVKLLDIVSIDLKWI